MNEHVEAGQERGQVRAKAREDHAARQAALRELGEQPTFEGPAAEAQDRELREFANELGQQREQPRMALAP